MGPRGTGKTWWTQHRFPDALRIDLLDAVVFRELAARPEGLRERATRVAPTDTAWLRVLNEGGTYRLQAGPYASREAAANALAQWRERLNLSPFVVESR